MQWLTDWKGRMIYASKQWQEFTGIDIKHLEGDPCPHLIHPGDLARITSEGAFAVSMMRPFYGRFRHFSAGLWREVLVYSQPVVENGIYRGYAGITRPLPQATAYDTEPRHDRIVPMPYPATLEQVSERCRFNIPLAISSLLAMI